MENKPWIHPKTGELMIGPRLCKHYINSDEVFKEIGKHKKILIIAPRRSGKTRLLKEYCNTNYNHYKKIFYNTVTLRQYKQFKVSLSKERQERINAILDTNVDTRCREVYNESYLMLFDESYFIDKSILYDYIEDDCHIISITSFTKNDTNNIEEFIESHKKNGFRVIYAQTYCNDDNYCIFNGKCIYCGTIIYSKMSMKCIHCGYLCT